MSDELYKERTDELTLIRRELRLIAGELAKLRDSMEVRFPAIIAKPNGSLTKIYRGADGEAVSVSHAHIVSGDPF